MALQKIGEKALAAIQNEESTAIASKKPDKTVLDEETYTSDLEKIIVRDFYPDLPRLQAQAEYLQALQNKDTQKLRELHIKYGPKRANATTTPNIYSTPATFETPDSQPKQTPGPQPTSKEGTSTQQNGDEKPTHNPEQPSTDKKKVDADLSLDRYLAKTTSEDNASFAEILQETQAKHRVKHAWLYEKEEEMKQEKKETLALPSIEVQAIEGPKKANLDSWNYTPKNSLMYVPEGVEDSPVEKIDKKGKPREIVHNNTRYDQLPFNLAKSKETINQAATYQAQTKHGKIGIDGKEVIPDQSPQVNGYGFMGTPSPAPGVDESPLMTWGEIEGTPFRLDGGDTPLTHTQGPVFKMPDVPRRDRLGMELAEEVGKAHRAKKQEALKRVSALSTPSPKFSSASRTERLSSMSPAAQRLASSKLGIRTHSDKALRASYTPSPTHRRLQSPALKTPTPSKSSRGATPKTTAGATPTPKRTNSEVTSLTDNLLNLPKRPKAQDFF